MRHIMQPVVPFLQTLLVPSLLNTLRGMPVSANSKAFAARLEEACSDKALPLRGRQSTIARELKVSQQAVRKWRAGEAYPDMSRAVELADWLNVNVVWLLQGTGPKRGERMDPNTRVLVEALQQMPRNERNEVASFIAFKVEGLKQWFAEEPRGRYLRAVDDVKRMPEATPQQSPQKAA